MTPAALSRLESALATARARTRGEVVVAVARSSGSYRDVDHLVAAVVATLALAGCLFLHGHARSVPEDAILPLVLAAYVSSLVASARVPLVRRLFTTRARRERQVHDAARAAFVQERAGSAPERAGVLVYVSLLERRAEVVPDHGVAGRIERARWGAIERAVAEECVRAGVLAGAEKGVAEIGASLATAFPVVDAAAPRAAAPVRVRP